jgi:hypothetical protein
MEELFENILKQAKVRRVMSQTLLYQTKKSIGRIKKEKNPFLAIVKWNLALTGIIHEISSYGTKFLMEEMGHKQLYSPNLPDIDAAIRYYNQEFRKYSDGFDPKKTTFKNYMDLYVNRNHIIGRLNYALRAATKACRDVEERSNLINTCCEAISLTNETIRFVNIILGAENARREPRDLPPLKLIDEIQQTDLEM